MPENSVSNCPLRIFSKKIFRKFNNKNKPEKAFLIALFFVYLHYNLKALKMIRRFDKQVADSISREGAKLIRTLLRDEDSSITEYRYRFTWCYFLTPCKYKNHDVCVGDYDCPHFVDSYIETSIQGSGVLSYAPYFAVGIGVVKCNKK